MSKVGDNKVGSKITGVKLSDIRKNSEVTAESTSLNAFSRFKASSGARFPTVPLFDNQGFPDDYNITHFRDHESYDEQGGKRVTYFTDKQCSIGTAKFDHRLETDYTFDQWGIDVKVEVSFENTFQSDKSQPKLHIYFKSLVGDVTLWSRNADWDSTTEPVVTDDFFNIQLVKPIFNLYDDTEVGIPTTDPKDKGELFHSVDNGDGSYTYTTGGLVIPTHGSISQNGSPATGEVSRVELPANGDWYKVQIIQLPNTGQILKYDVDNASAPRQDRVEYPLHPEDGDSNDIQISLSYIDKIEVKPAVSDNYDYEKLSMERFADAGKKQGYVRKVFEWNKKHNFVGLKLDINETGLDYSGDAGYTTACFVLTVPSNTSSTTDQWVDNFITTYGYPEVNGFELTNTNHVYSEDRENGTGCVMIFWGHVPDDKLLNDGTKGTFILGDAYESLPQAAMDVGQDGNGTFWYPTNGGLPTDPEVENMYQAALYFMVGVGRSSSDFVHTYYLDEDNHPWNIFGTDSIYQAALDLDELESCPTEMWKVLSLDDELSKGAYCTIGGGAGETAVDVSTMNRFSWNQLWWNLASSFYPPSAYDGYPIILPAWYHTTFSSSCNISVQNGIVWDPNRSNITELGYVNSNPEPEMSFMAVSREDVTEMYDGGTYDSVNISNNSFGKFWTNWLKPNPGLPISAKNTGGNEYLDSIGIGGATDRTDQEISYDLDNGNISVTNADAKLHFYRDNMFFEVYDYIPNTEDFYKAYFEESPNLKLEITGIPYTDYGTTVFIDSDIWGWDIDDPRSLATRTLVRKDGSATITVNDYPILTGGDQHYQIKVANHNPGDLSEIITETIPSGTCTSFSGASLTSPSINARIFPDGVEPNHEIPWGACPNPSLFDKSEVYNTPWHGSYLALNPNPITNHYYRGGSFDDYLSSKSIGCDAYSIFDADYPSRYRTMSIYGNVLNLVSFRWDTSNYRPPNYPITKRTISTRDHHASMGEPLEKSDIHSTFSYEPNTGEGRSANVRPQCVKFTESLQIKNAYNANVTGSTTWAGHNTKDDSSTFSGFNDLGTTIHVPEVFDEPYGDKVNNDSPMSNLRANLSPGAYHRARAERDIPVSAETEFYAPHGMSMMSLPFFDGYSDSTDFGSGLGRFDGNYTKFERPDDPDERSFVFKFDASDSGGLPSDGYFRSNSTYQNKYSGQLYFSLEDINSNEVSSYLQSLFDVEATVKGTLTATNNADATDSVTFNITSGQFGVTPNSKVILNVTLTTKTSDLYDHSWNDGENYTFAFDRAEPSIEADGNDDYIDLGFTFRVVCVDHDVTDHNCPIYEVYMSSASSIQNFKHGGGHCKTVINELPEVTDYPLKGVEAPLDSRGKRIERLVSRFKPSANRHPDSPSQYLPDSSEQDWEMFSIKLGLHTEYPRNEILFDKWVADQSDSGNDTLVNPIFIGLDDDKATDHYSQNNYLFDDAAPDLSGFTVDTGIISKFHGTPTDTEVQLILEDYPDTDPTYSQAYHNSYYNSWADGVSSPLWENSVDPEDINPSNKPWLVSSSSDSEPYNTNNPRKYDIIAEAVYTDDTDNPANIGIRFRTNDGEAKSIKFGPELYAQNYYDNLGIGYNLSRGFADITFDPTPIDGVDRNSNSVRVTIPEQNIVDEGYYSINIPERGFSEVYWAESGNYLISEHGHSGNNETILTDYEILNAASITSSIQGKTALMQYTDTYPWDNVADTIQQYYTDFKEIHGYKSLGEGYTDVADDWSGAPESIYDPSNDWWNFGPALDDYQDGKAYPGTASIEVGGLQQEVHLTSLGVSTDVTYPLGNPEVMGDSDDFTAPFGTSPYYPQNEDKNAGYGLIRIGNQIGASVGLKVVNRFHKKDLTDLTGSWGYDRSHRVGDDPEKNRKLYERVQSLKIYGTQILPKDESENVNSRVNLRPQDSGAVRAVDLIDEIMFRTKFEGMVTYPKEAEFNLAFIDRTATVNAANSGNPYYMEHANTNDDLTGQSTTDASMDRDGYVYGVLRHSGDDATSLNSGWENTIIKLNVGDKLVINRSSATLTQGDVHIDEEFLIRKTNLDNSKGSSAAAKANWQVINSAYTGVQVGDHEYVEDGQEYIWTDISTHSDSNDVINDSSGLLRPVDEDGNLVVAHGFSTGQPVIVSLTGSFGPLVSGRKYYVKDVTAPFFTLYDTKANAEAGTPTGRVEWSQADKDNATGDLTITPDNSLQIIQTVDPDTGAPSFVHGAHSTLEWYTDQAEPGFYAVTLGVDNATNAATYPRVYALIDLRSNCFNDDKLIINAPFGHIPLSSSDSLKGLHWWADAPENNISLVPDPNNPSEDYFSDRKGMPYGNPEYSFSNVYLKRGDVITFDYKGSTGTVNSDKPYGFKIKYETTNSTTSPNPNTTSDEVTIGVENSIGSGIPDSGTLIWDTTYSPAGLYYLTQVEFSGNGENVPDSLDLSLTHKTYFKIIVSEF